MAGYALKRALLVPPTLLGAALLVFVLLRLVPGDVCQLRMEDDGFASGAQALALCRADHGLDAPWPLQLGRFLRDVLALDLGVSMWTDRPVVHEIASRFPLTAQLALMAMAVAVLLALPLGVLAAARRQTWVDYTVRTFAIAGEAIPSFWLGIMLVLGMLILTQRYTGTPWMPPLDYRPLWVDPVHNLTQLALPALAAGYRASAVLTRMTRSAMLEVLREDYVRSARANGVGPWSVHTRHALRNAMLPVVTLVGMEFAFLMGGLVVIEQVFNLNGLGRLLVRAVQLHDYTLTQGLVLLVVAIFAVANLLVDLVYCRLDPRVRYA